MNVLIFLFIVSISCERSVKDHRKVNPGDSSLLNKMESAAEFWSNKAQNHISAQLHRKFNSNRAKNIIMFLGDGMSLTTVAAARKYVQSEQTQLSFEQFPHFGFSKTYCVDSQVADSACSATAYLNGVKANYKTIGVNAKVLHNDCRIDESDLTESIASWAQKSGKATGIVTTTRITHASPAGAFAHTSNRDWEHNDEISDKCKANRNTNVRDIAYQLIHNKEAQNLRVMLGGGRGYFINSTEIDEEGRRGLRTDGKHLIDEWINERSKRGKARFVWHNQQLKFIDVDETDFLLGLFEHDHCLYNLDIKNHNLEYQEPSLTDMTTKAIKMLQKEENGFFLFVEGGRIDHAHHQNWAQKALEETKEFSRAIETARQMTDEADTLIVVTSDHSHVFTYNGYPSRGSDILGMPRMSDIDLKPFLTVSYANGPGYSTTYDKEKLRMNLTSIDIHHPNFKHQATVSLEDDTHAGEDVGVYASGPWSHLFVGNLEQNNIPLLMAYASRIGPFFDSTQESAACSKSFSFALLTIFVFATMSFL